MTRAWLIRVAVILLCFGAAGCASSADDRSDTDASGTVVALDLDKSDPERLLIYYLGGYASAEGSDPVEAGLLRADGSSYGLDRSVLAARHPEAAARLAEADVLDWEAFAAFLQATYYDARALPPTVEALRAELPSADSAWFTVEVNGVMTTARRRVSVPLEALQAAIEAYADNGEAVIYPVGTTFIGEHWQDGAVVETTAMRKRADGFWDYMTYGPDGRLAAETTTEPRALQTPTQCAGCHFGDRQFEPERSFPAEARPGPHGPRVLHVDEALRDLEVVRFFDEHRKRSDTVLGLYATLYVSELRAKRTAGTLGAEEAALLASLGL